MTERQNRLNVLYIDSEELEKLERGYSEVAAQLAGLESKADDLAQQVAKSTAERDELVQKLEEGRCFTKAEVFRLQGESEIRIVACGELTSGRSSCSRV